MTYNNTIFRYRSRRFGSLFTRRLVCLTTAAERSHLGPWEKTKTGPLLTDCQKFASNGVGHFTVIAELYALKHGYKHVLRPL